MAYIESVRLRGFKAVGNDWLEVSFGSGLNAIVGERGQRRLPPALPSRAAFPNWVPACAPLPGPNGCGKSSLLEALCFAFAAPLRSFGVAALADLANTDSVQVQALQDCILPPTCTKSTVFLRCRCVKCTCSC
jgi:hypothetical protein